MVKIIIYWYEWIVDYSKSPTSIKPGVIRNVFGEIGQQDRDGESDVFRRIVEAIRELVEIDASVLVGIDAHHYVIDLLPDAEVKQWDGGEREVRSNMRR